MTLTAQDLNVMQTYGRYAARDDDRVAIRNAAENLAIVGPRTDEGIKLEFWLLEGVRNYARDQRHVEEVMSEVSTLALAIVNEQNDIAPQTPQV